MKNQEQSAQFSARFSSETDVESRVVDTRTRKLPRRFHDVLSTFGRVFSTLLLASQLLSVITIHTTPQSDRTPPLSCLVSWASCTHRLRASWWPARRAGAPNTPHSVEQGAYVRESALFPHIQAPGITCSLSGKPFTSGTCQSVELGTSATRGKFAACVSRFRGRYRCAI